jgi:hypothetical protein
MRSRPAVIDQASYRHASRQDVARAPLADMPSYFRRRTAVTRGDRRIRRRRKRVNLLVNGFVDRAETSLP